jgi:hypothetical protein
MKNIFLFLCLLLFSCQKAGKTNMPFWVQANNGNEKSATVSTSDVNGVPLPEKLPKPEQEVATTGDVTISGQLETNNCYKDGETVPCENVTENLANTVILVSAENQTLATATVAENNSFVLQAQDVDSGNYRVIVENNENTNWTYTDVSVTINPPIVDNSIFTPLPQALVDTEVQPTETVIQLPVLVVDRKYFDMGPAKIIGNVNMDKYTSLDNSFFFDEKPLKNVKVSIYDENNQLISQTVTIEDGSYQFDIPQLKNGLYSLMLDANETSYLGRAFQNQFSMFRFTFLGDSENVTTIQTIDKINLKWIPAEKSKISLKWKLNSSPFIDNQNFKISLIGDKEITNTISNTEGYFEINADLITGVYNLKITKDNYYEKNIAIPFTVKPTGEMTEIAQNGDIILYPNKMTKINNTVIGLDSKVLEGELNFKPNSNFSISHLQYLLTRDDWKNIVQTWINEACLANTQCANICKNDNQCVFKTLKAPFHTETIFSTKTNQLPPGVWDIAYSAPFYKSSEIKTVNLNFEDINLTNTILEPSLLRNKIGGSVTVLDQLTNGNKYCYGKKINNYISMPGLENLMMVIWYNDYAIVSLTDKDGLFKIDENTKVIKLNGAIDKEKYVREKYRDAQLLNKSELFGNLNSLVYEYYLLAGTYTYSIVDIYDHLITINGVIDNNQNGVLTEDIVVQHKKRKNLTGYVTDAITTLGLQSDIEINTYLDPENLSGITRSFDRRNDQFVAKITSDAFGKFTLNNVDSQNYLLTVKKNNYEQYVINYLENLVSISTQIVSNIGTGNLKGTVYKSDGSIFNGQYTIELNNIISNNKPIGGIPSSINFGQTTFTNSSTYNLYSINSGVWKLTFKSDKYLPVEAVVSITPGSNTNFDIITAIDQSTVESNVGGTILNAFNNALIKTEINVSLINGLNNKDGQVIDTVKTTSGSFLFSNVKAGNYTIKISGNGYTDTIQNVISAGNLTPVNKILVSPILNNDEIRVVLAWGKNPSDLDSHMLFGNTKTCNIFGMNCKWNEVYWNQTSGMNGDIKLDVDVTDSYGPETITSKGTAFNNKFQGYYVYNYTKAVVNPFAATIANSGASVKIYKKEGLVKSFYTDSSQINNSWRILCLTTDRRVLTYGDEGCKDTNF